MAKERTIDPGLQYLRDIGFKRIKGKYGLADRWIKVFGRAKADQLFDRRETIPDGSVEFYDFKNSDPEISKSYSEAYDGDIIRKACNYIADHKEYFGNTILEVGCDTGYMTGFLARTFPESKIVSIDRNKAAIDLASQKIKAMGIGNVELRVSSLEEISGEQFDTVFCMRTIQENLDYDNALFEGEPILAQFYQYASLTEEYTKNLISCLKDNGYLCVFERVGHDPLMCGWMMELCFSECAPIIDTYTEVKCEEVDNINTFQAFICRNGEMADIQTIIELTRSCEREPGSRNI